MSTEIPIWVNGKIRWLSGIDKKTTCKDVVEVLLDREGLNKAEAKDFTIMERWRKVERQLDENSKILKIWNHWGNEKKEVRLCLRRIDNEVDSGRGSPVGGGYISSLRRKRNRIRGIGKPPWAFKETLHPRRLAELGRFEDYPHIEAKQSEAADDYEPSNETILYDKIHSDKNIYSKTRDTENVNNRKTSGHKSYHCSGTGRLHSTPFSDNHSKRPKCCSKRESKQKTRNSENIEKLMKLILVQGATIQSQLQKLKEREEQIELLEQERHRERVEKNGRNYLLETYLGSLKDAEIPKDLNDIENENEIPRAPENSNEIEADINVNKNSSKDESDLRVERTLPFKTQHKSTRSKSESRAQECKLEGHLKRTLSDNGIAETNNSSSNCIDAEVTENTKDDYEDLIELKRIQSQIEIWEKVFKINKKLEKEEENLVRLHIKIKKIQSENYRIAKEKSENSEDKNESVLSPNKEESNIEINEEEKMQYEHDCVELEKNLEALKCNLEHNRKEIYKNFTKLMKEDEIVAQKRSCLQKIMTDLERTNYEHDKLNEMIAMKGNKNEEQNQITTFCEGTINIEGKNTDKSLKEGLPKENNLKREESAVVEGSQTSNLCSDSCDLWREQENVNQRTEMNVGDQEMFSMKPKIVKISFEDKIQNCDGSENSQEKLLFKNPTPVPTGALKSILKNRRNGYNKMCNLNNELTKNQNQGIPQTYDINNDRVAIQKNFNMNNSYMQNYNTNPSQVPNQVNSSYPYTIPYPLYVNFPNEHNQVFNGQLTKLSENLKGVCLLKNSHPAEINRAPFAHSTIVTTKALVHNDTDSSTSSDTSGLSSMYSSSSTTVEEPFVEKNYVLDTLV